MYLASIVLNRTVLLEEDFSFLFHIFLVICNVRGDVLAQYEFHGDSRSALDVERAFATLYATVVLYKTFGLCGVLVEGTGDIALLEQQFARIQTIPAIADCIHLPSGLWDLTMLTDYIVPSLVYAGDLHVSPFAKTEDALLNAIVGKYNIVHTLNAETEMERAHRNAFVYAQVMLSWQQRIVK